ncbi:13814_t:CDS:1, partial [Dentiscutata erythropus]
YDKHLEGLWIEFNAFCNTHNLVAHSAHPNTVVIFLTWANMTSCSANLYVYVAAISRYHRSNRLEDPTTDYNVQRL